MAEQTYFLKHLPGLFAEGGEALSCKRTDRPALLLFLAHLISLSTLAAFSIRFHLCFQILFSRETELRHQVLQVVLESKSSGWILGLCLLAV